MPGSSKGKQIQTRSKSKVVSEQLINCDSANNAKSNKMGQDRNNSATVAVPKVKYRKVKPSAADLDLDMPKKQSYDVGDGIILTMSTPLPEPNNDEIDSEGEDSVDQMSDEEPQDDGFKLPIPSTQPSGDTRVFETAADRYQNDPGLKKFMENWLEDKWQEKLRQEGSMASETPIPKTPEPGISGKNQGVKTKTANRVIKSPSDTTLYRPALAHRPEDNIDFMNKISEFVESVCIDQHPQDAVTATPADVMPEVSAAPQTENVQPFQQNQTSVEVDEERERAQHLILDAEKFKATIAAPTDIVQNTVTFPPVITERQPQGFTDDDFFHPTCHIDGNLSF